jgi:hypothetical protein
LTTSHSVVTYYLVSIGNGRFGVIFDMLFEKARLVEVLLAITLNLPRLEFIHLPLRVLEKKQPEYSCDMEYGHLAGFSTEIDGLRVEKLLGSQKSFTGVLLRLFHY